MPNSCNQLTLSMIEQGLICYCTLAQVVCILYGYEDPYFPAP